MRKTAAFVLTAVFLLIFCACKQSGAPKQDTKDYQVLEAKADSAGEYAVITTPYADLCLKRETAKNIICKLEGDSPYTVAFYSKADNTKLYSLNFDGSGEAVLGTLIGEKENTVVYLTPAQLDAAAKDYSEHAALQETVNDITEKLVLDYGFIINETVISENTATYNIKTSVAILKYPERWKNKVTVETETERVRFSSYKTKLFDLVFTECEGYLLGRYNETPIYIINYPVDTDEQSAMQEDVNVILQELSKDSNFKMNG